MAMKKSFGEMHSNEKEMNTRSLDPYSINSKKIGPVVPPKPQKKQNSPEVPKSCFVKQICEPLYSQRLQCLETCRLPNSSQFNKSVATEGRCPILKKKQLYSTPNSMYEKTSKITLDNPAVLEQQLEALAHHKKQLEKKGLLLSKLRIEDQRISSLQNIPRNVSTSLMKIDKNAFEHPKAFYTNIDSTSEDWNYATGRPNIYSNVNSYNKKLTVPESLHQHFNDERNSKPNQNIYSNADFNKKQQQQKKDNPSSVLTNDSLLVSVNNGYDNNSSPPSPVSSSYSELRRATDYSKKQPAALMQSKTYTLSGNGNCLPICKNLMGFNGQTTYMNMNSSSDFTTCSPILQCPSSTYESIYEPIHPRPSSQLSSRSFLMYAPYSNIDAQQTGIVPLSDTNTTSVLENKNFNDEKLLFGRSIDVINSSMPEIKSHNDKEAEVEALTDLLVHTLDTGNDVDSYGTCFNCNEAVMGENSGCTAMDHIYHISCFTCSQCHINLQGKPFYALEGKPYCENDYLQTLEKCSVCMKPILERILRATGKPYHPQCFTCIVCGNSLDGIPFTVDATNQNYCIEDFHKKFAPRCCVCKEPIMPESGEEETIRVVALDRSFHFECYKCEDCGLLLSSEAEGRGCYPLDDHVLCKSCNAQRVQMLTNKIITEL